MDQVIKKAEGVRLAVFDVDGVLTTGSLMLTEDGSEIKVFHVHDGLGLVMLRKTGCHVGIISARTSSVVTARMSALGIEDVYQGQDNKDTALTALMQKLGVTAEQTAYVGDDLIDLAPMKIAGLAVAVANAHPFVKKQADWVTSQSGGQGAVREICELLLQAQGKLEDSYRHYLGQ